MKRKDEEGESDFAEKLDDLCYQESLTKKERRRFFEATFGSCDLQRSKSRPLTFVLRAASCWALIKLCKHPNHQPPSATIHSYFIPSPCFVSFVTLHNIPLNPYHRTVIFLHLMTLKASLTQISADEQECAVIASG